MGQLDSAFQAKTKECDSLEKEYKKLKEQGKKEGAVQASAAKDLQLEADDLKAKLHEAKVITIIIMI
jgi:hypothetical protein